MSKRILITGVAGFIGFHLALALLKQGSKVIGIDNLNDYYEPTLKEKRLEFIFARDNASNFSFVKMDISDRDGVESLFASNAFDVVVNLAAQAGVRYRNRFFRERCELWLSISFWFGFYSKGKSEVKMAN